MTWAGSDNATIVFLAHPASTAVSSTRFLLRLANNMYLDGYRCAVVNLGHSHARPRWLVPPFSAHETTDDLHSVLQLAGKRVAVGTTTALAFHAVSDAHQTGMPWFFLADCLITEADSDVDEARMMAKLLATPSVLTHAPWVADSVERIIGRRPWTAAPPIESVFFEPHAFESDGATVIYSSDSTSPRVKNVMANGFRALRKLVPDVRLASHGYEPEARLSPSLVTHTVLAWENDNSFIRRDALARAACFVWTAVDETVPFAAMQAMAVGCPVVAMRTAAAPGCFEDGVNCLVVAPDDAEELGAAMHRIFTDAALRDRLVGGGRQAVAGNTWRRVLDALPETIAAERRPDGAVGLDAIRWELDR